MNAEFIVYAFVGEAVFAAMAAGALLTLAALLKVLPPEMSRGRPAGARHHMAVPSNDGPGRLNEQKESVMAGMQTSAEEHPDKPEAADHSPLAQISSYM